ncbi:MAG: M48 family metallopeptidase, partial [Puniceicoccales bacterium]|nr:M48 family metallopeptidase [Puniceicoccales bacterium]
MRLRLKTPMEAEIFEIPDGAGGTARVSVEWRVSAKARRVRLSLPAKGNPQIVLPANARRAVGLRLLQTHGEWLLKALQRREKRQAAEPPAQTLSEYLARVPQVTFAGRACPLHCQETTLGRPFFVFRGDASEPVIFKHRAGDFRETDLLALLRGLAAKTLPPRVAELAARVGVTVDRVTVRDQSSRWGSCSRRSTLSLNWRLVLLPPELQDHVIYHELAHRRVMNHSAQFWRQLNAWDPCTA